MAVLVEGARSPLVTCKFSFTLRGALVRDVVTPLLLWAPLRGALVRDVVTPPVIMGYCLTSY